VQDVPVATVRDTGLLEPDAPDATGPPIDQYESSQSPSQAGAVPKHFPPSSQYQPRGGFLLLTRIPNCGDCVLQRRQPRGPRGFTGGGIGSLYLMFPPLHGVEKRAYFKGISRWGVAGFGPAASMPGYGTLRTLSATIGLVLVWPASPGF
jgi:hypothetical protein